MIKTRTHNKWSLPKAVIILGVVTLLTGQLLLPSHVVSAQPVKTQYTKPDTVSPFSRGLQGLFGLNALAGWIGSRQLEKEIRKKVDGPLDVDLEPFSALDLKDGKARKLTIFGQNLLYDKAVHISEFHMATDENTPIWVDLDNGKLKSPLKAKVSMRVNEPDINKTLTTQTVSEALGKIKVPILGVDSQTLRVIRPEIAFHADRLRFQGNLGVVGMPDERSVHLDMETGLEPIPPENTKIGLKHLKIAPISGISDTRIVESMMTRMLSKFLNPSKFIPMDNGTFTVEHLTITEDAIVIKGHVLVLPESGISSQSVP